MASKVELERQVKLLRNQMAKLKKRCEEREDRLVSLIETIGPFLPILHDAAQKQIMANIDT